MKVYEYGKDDFNVLFDRLRERSPEGRKDIEEAVSGILHSVKERGDRALADYTREFDGVALDAGALEVSKFELEGALLSIDKELLKIMEQAAANIKAFHERQRENSWFMTQEDGTLLGQKVTPLNRVLS